MRDSGLGPINQMNTLKHMTIRIGLQKLMKRRNSLSTRYYLSRRQADFLQLLALTSSQACTALPYTPFPNLPLKICAWSLIILPGDIPWTPWSTPKTLLCKTWQHYVSRSISQVFQSQKSPLQTSHIQIWRGRHMSTDDHAFSISTPHQHYRQWWAWRQLI